jgi:hypothetical protein
MTTVDLSKSLFFFWGYKTLYIPLWGFKIFNCYLYSKIYFTYIYVHICVYTHKYTHTHRVNLVNLIGLGTA